MMECRDFMTRMTILPLLDPFQALNTSLDLYNYMKIYVGSPSFIGLYTLCDFFCPLGAHTYYVTHVLEEVERGEHIF